MVLFCEIPSESFASRARAFVAGFLDRARPRRYIFGTNAFAQAVAEHIVVDGFIDEFTASAEFCGKPIVPLGDIPKGALVLTTVTGIKPWTVRRKLDAAGFENLDYFAFRKFSGLSLPSPFYWDDFRTEFSAHRTDYERLHACLADATSKKHLADIVNFRLTSDLECLAEYRDIQDRQYFEPFLNIAREGETFADVGGFDGYTTAEFIRLCPRYRAVHFFEPDANNMNAARQKLAGFERIKFYSCGLSDRRQNLRFGSAGSASRARPDGDAEIKLDRFDDVVDGEITFLKMDIEGAEIPALRGAEDAIRRWHPRLAIAAYHNIDDFRIIPARVLAVRPDYDVYLRHYTEGTTETVMFFVPRGPSS